MSVSVIHNPVLLHIHNDKKKKKRNQRKSFVTLNFALLIQVFIYVSLSSALFEHKNTLTVHMYPFTQNQIEMAKNKNSNLIKSPVVFFLAFAIPTAAIVNRLLS